MGRVQPAECRWIVLEAMNMAVRIYYGRIIYSCKTVRDARKCYGRFLEMVQVDIMAIVCVAKVCTGRVLVLWRDYG